MLPIRDPASIVIAVSGEGGNYALVCPTLGASLHHHPSITQAVEIEQVCELPPRPTG